MGIQVIDSRKYYYCPTFRQVEPWDTGKVALNYTSYIAQGLDLFAIMKNN